MKLPNGKGRKSDQEKRRTDLMPINALNAFADVLTHGARKYGDRNWERGMKWSRLYGATLRHLFAWWEGENKDPETGLHHLAHALCCVAFLLAYALWHGYENFDDRPQNMKETNK